MATAAAVQISPHVTGVFSSGHHDTTNSTTTSSLLQENHNNHHIFFNANGFHNHIAHHLLTIYSIGATPEQIRHAYEINKDSQRPMLPVNEENVKAMSDPAKFQSFLGEEQYYHDWMAFFQREVDNNPGGWQAVLQEHLLSRTPNAEELLVRMYAGFLHPLIHLGFGVEFAQPAIIVEALAQAAVHKGWIGPYLLEAERRTEAASASSEPPDSHSASLNGTNSSSSSSSVPVENKSILSLLDAVHDDKTLSTAAHWSDDNKIRDGILVRAPEEMLAIASQYHISLSPDRDNRSSLSTATAEMIDANTYFTAAAQSPPHKPKFDFYFMHCLNCSIFFSAFLDPQHDSWLSDADRKRLLEWKVRLDLAMYASRRSPVLRDNVDRLEGYKSRNHRGESWEQLFECVRKYEDDAHASKLLRALGHGAKVCETFPEDGKSFPIRGAKLWLNIGRMALDSLEDLKGEERRWVRSAGFEEAWLNIPEWDW